MSGQTGVAYLVNGVSEVLEVSEAGGKPQNKRKPNRKRMETDGPGLLLLKVSGKPPGQPNQNHPVSHKQSAWFLKEKPVVY